MEKAGSAPMLWREEYAIGVADIDSQHQKLFGLLNKLIVLHDERPSPVPRTRDLMDLLESFNEYAAYHFLTEEALMREHLPADESTVKHIVAHRSYWMIIAEFKKRFQEGDAKVNGELVEYLNRWWVNHILQTDQQMGRELNQRGVE